MNYSEAIEFLYQLRLFGAKLGLEKVQRLAALHGNPHHRLRFVHLAGTNGKGSTCAMLESIYRSAGLRVGLFTSPHLVSFRERIQVDRALIPERAVIERVLQIQASLVEFPSESPPTFFEVVTVMALLHFAEQQCDLVVWETGLGGRLDATNIVTPLASVITNIQLDHQRWLGQTEEDIALEKAGIMKPGIPAITTEQKPDIVAVLEKAARSIQAPFTHVRQNAVNEPILRSSELPLLGDHQMMNAALAIATVRCLRDQIPVTEQAISEGLAKVQWPGRFQMVRTSPKRIVVLDGAHNMGGMEALVNALGKLFPGLIPTIVFGVMRDKDWQKMCQLLMPLAGRICLAPVNSERSTPPELIRDICLQTNAAVSVEVYASVQEALNHTFNDRLVLVTGSLHFIGEAMEALQLAPRSSASEQGKNLNDWQVDMESTR